MGGGIWYQNGNVVSAIAPVLSEYPRPVLVGLRSDREENGYRFDLNSFDPSAETYLYWPEVRCTAECVIQTLATSGNVEFIWSMPTPVRYSATPYANPSSGDGYPWQKASYYAAYLQYLIAPVSMTPAQYNSLNTGYNFFTDASCTTLNTSSESAVGGNWANLRAKRGHPEPYTLQAVILGIEPYGDAQEALGQDGQRYGQIAEAFRLAIRARGGVLSSIALGLNVTEGGAISDVDKPWFTPMLAEVTESDFSYLDMHHHYRFGNPTDELNRIFPTLINVTPINPPVLSPGWQNWWKDQSEWLSDFSRYLWMYEDVRVALANSGENPNRWLIGNAEHGLSITSQFIGNDMGAGLHWALWLSELMRYNAHWDMNWVLAEQGWAHAQLQFRDGHLTRTPSHYVYKMAQEFYGYEHLANTYASPTAATGTADGATYSSPDVEVRVFRNPADNRYHLFVVNKHASNPVNITGWENWIVSAWKKLGAANFTDQNPIGNPWTPETIKTVQVTHTPGQPLTIPPISVNHIELAVPTGTSDPTFNPGTGPDNMVNAVARQSDGKIILGGTFGYVNGTSRPKLARLNSNGTVDNGSYWYYLNFNGSVYAVAVQADGKILVGGDFSSVYSYPSWVTRNKLARLNADGSLDTTFSNPYLNGTVRSIAVLPDGSVLVGGDFVNNSPYSPNYIARYSSTGSMLWSPGTVPGANGPVQAVIADGTSGVIIGGNFTSVNGTSRTRLARLTTSGSVDPNFNTSINGPSSTVFALARQTDAKILIGGDFTMYGATSRNRIARVNTNGSVDTGFNPGMGMDNTVYAVVVQDTGKVIIGGAFTSYAYTSRKRVARLNADGTLDSVFNSGSLVNDSYVKSISLTPDAKVILGGTFTTAGGSAWNRVGRVNN